LLEHISTEPTSTHLTEHITRPNSSDYPLPPPLPRAFQPLTPSDASALEKFLFFIGYGRSGHSLVAGMMDAHPDVIVAHELYLFDKLAKKDFADKMDLYNRLYFSSYIAASSGWRANKNTSKGYNLHLKESWQGQFRKLRVIGDKTAGATAMMYHNSPPKFMGIIRNLTATTGVPLRVVHVVRNPYDMIATVALYHASSRLLRLDIKYNATREHPLDNLSVVEQATTNIMAKALAVRSIADLEGMEVLELHLENLVYNVSKEVGRICDFLEVSCSKEYVEACQQKVFSRPSESRHLVAWPEAVKTRVARMIKRISFFRRYSFHN